MRAGLLAVVVFGALLLLPGLGRMGALDSTDARYLAIGREMWAHGDDWVVPRLAGAPHLDKPPLAYWSAALGYSLFGPNEFAGRFVEQLALIGTALVVYTAARRWASPAWALPRPSVPQHRPALRALARSRDRSLPAALRERRPRRDRRRRDAALDRSRRGRRRLARGLDAREGSHRTARRRQRLGRVRGLRARSCAAAGAWRRARRRALRSDRPAMGRVVGASQPELLDWFIEVQLRAASREPIADT